MSISVINLTVDSAPGTYGFADELALEDDSWTGVRTHAYKPYIFGLTDLSLPPIIQLSGGWLCSDPDNSGEVYIVLYDRSKTRISPPILLYVGMVLNTNAYTAEIVGVKRGGHLRLLHGSGAAPFVNNLASSAETRTFTVNYTGVSTWQTYQGPDGDPAYGVVRVSPVECGLGGNYSTNRPLGSVNITLANFEFLEYGFVTFRQSQDLIGTVTGGIYVGQFDAFNSTIFNGAFSNGAVSSQPQPWQFLAVYYKLTAAGVTAGALPPDRKFQVQVSRPYNRSKTPYSVV